MDLLTMFAFTGVWVWIWAVVFFFLILAFAENEKNTFAFISLGIFTALLYNSNYITLSIEPLTAVMYFAIYFALGGVWSFIKWASFVTGEADKFGVLKMQYITAFNRDSTAITNRAALSATGDESWESPLEVKLTTAIPKNLQDSFLEYIINRSDYVTSANVRNVGIQGVIPSAMGSKERIVTWILWWPTSAFWTILNDPLVRLANWMYGRFQGLYEKIANRAFAKFEL